MTITHHLAAAWLERVERLAADLPPGDRAELLADLRDHLEMALAPDAATEDVEAVLARLGDPADVVAAARTDAGVPSPTPGDRATGRAPAVPAGLLTQEVIALAALVLAGLVSIFVWPVTLLLWAIGIAIVASGGRWRGGEVVAMLLLPIAWALPVLSLVVPVGSSVGTCVVDATGQESCSTVEQSGIGGPWVLVAVLAGLVLVLLGTRWLARAPRGRRHRS